MFSPPSAVILGTLIHEFLSLKQKHEPPARSSPRVILALLIDAMVQGPEVSNRWIRRSRSERSHQDLGGGSWVWFKSGGINILGNPGEINMMGGMIYLYM